MVLVVFVIIIANGYLWMKKIWVDVILIYKHVSMIIPMDIGE
jgi:hypothetical protein